MSCNVIRWKPWIWSRITLGYLVLVLTQVAFRETWFQATMHRLERSQGLFTKGRIVALDYENLTSFRFLNTVPCCRIFVLDWLWVRNVLNRAVGERVFELHRNHIVTSIQIVETRSSPQKTTAFDFGPVVGPSLRTIEVQNVNGTHMRCPSLYAFTWLTGFSATVTFSNPVAGDFESIEFFWFDRNFKFSGFDVFLKSDPGWPSTGKPVFCRSPKDSLAQKSDPASCVVPAPVSLVFYS